MRFKHSRTISGRQVVIVADPSGSDLVRATLTELQKAVRKQFGRRLHIVMNPETTPDANLLDDPAGVIYVVHQPQRPATQRILSVLEAECGSARAALTVYIQNGHHHDSIAPSNGLTAMETLWEEEFYFGHGGTVNVSDSADAALHRGLDALSRATVSPTQMVVA